MLDESQTKVARTLLSVVPPVLQTRAPTGKTLGPSFTLLLSRPTTFQVVGVMESCACALPDPTPVKRRKSASSHSRDSRRDLCSGEGARISVAPPCRPACLGRSFAARLCSCRTGRRG